MEDSEISIPEFEGVFDFGNHSLAPEINCIEEETSTKEYIISLLGNISITFCPKTRIAIRNFLTQIIGLRRNSHKKDKKKRIWYTPPHTFP